MIRWLARLVPRAFFAIVALAVLIALPASGARAASSEDDARFLAGLRQRRLFELAERHCQQRLASQEASEAEQSELVIELARTLALHAANAPPSGRGALWTRARQTADDFLRQRPRHPRQLLVRVQRALVDLAQGELLRQEAEVSLAATPPVDEARQALRAAARGLEEIDKQLALDIPQAHRQPPPAGGLSAEQLLALQQQVRQYAARAGKNLGLTYPAGSDDRLATLLEAVRQLQQPLAQLPPDDPLAPALALDLAECRRLARDFSGAAQALAAVDREGAPAELRLRARAEQARLALDAGDPARALEALRQGRALAGSTSADLDFAHLETYVALWRAAAAAQDESQAANWQKKAADTVKFLEEAHGPYWGRRGEQLLVAWLPRGAGGANLDILRRAADSLFLKGQLEEALAAYDQGAQQARAAGDSAAEFELAYKAALLEQRQGRGAQAAGRLRQLAQALPQHPQAADAELLAAWNLAQDARRDPQSLPRYQALLRELAQTWPTSAAADQARLWLGNLHQNQRQWTEAIAAYGAVGKDSPHLPAAVAGAAAAWSQQLDQLAAERRPTDATARQAAQYFRGLVAAEGAPLPEKWNDAQRQAALAAAQLILRHQPASAADAEELLAAAVAGSPDAPAEWQAAARSQYVVALAAQPGRRSEAERLLQATADAAPQQLLELLAGLARLSQGARPELRQGLAALQLRALHLLEPKRSQLDAAAALALDRLRAEALAAAGQRREAQEAFARLAREHPQSGEVQEGYAELLSAADDRPSLELALAQWRVVAAKSPPRSERWFRAKYAVAETQLRLGDKAGAAQLARYLVEIPPGLRDTPWEAKFQGLLQRAAP